MDTFQPDLSFAQQLDNADPLKSFRDEFLLPASEGRQQIYFLGNSLGLQPRATAAAIQEVLDQWASLGVESFFMGSQPWLEKHDALLPAMSRIVGALPEELVIMNQLTVNLHLMLQSFYHPKGKRNKILCEARAFPSDQYMLASHVQLRGLDPAAVIVEVKPRANEEHVRKEDIEAAIHEHREELALVLWSGVQYYTGQVFDIAAICALAHAYNIPVGFDLAHAAGNIPLKLHEWDLDFACFCNYKYLNAGPGAIATAFIHKRYHSRSDIPRMAGWWGNEKASRFLMRDHFVPEANASGWQLSTPSILLYACLKASIDIFDKAGMDALHVKRRSMHAYFQYLYKQKIVQKLSEKIRIITPAEFLEPGCQFSLQVPEKGRQVFEALGSRGIMVDWREPEVIRLAPVPLYNRYEEIWHFVNALEEIAVEVQ